jgi:hypothetical protein
MPLDIGVGILLAVAVSAIFHMPLTIFLVICGIAATLFPDVDIITAPFGTWKHRELTHYPIVYIPLVIFLFILMSIPYAALVTAGIYLHLIHDTFGTGWGLAWLWPFTNRRFILLPVNYMRNMRAFETWLPEERPEYAHSERYKHWIRDLYLKPSVISITEHGFLVVAIGILIWYVR